MSVVKILTVPNKKLKTVCQEISDFDQETEKLAQNLLDTVRVAKNPIGAGLAAPQIGVLKRMCVVRKFPDDFNEENPSGVTDYVLVNPKITRKSKNKELGWEGCLSIPDVYTQVERAQKVTVQARNQFGEKINLNASGFFARVIQHELDHLNGVLITDKNVGRVLNEENFEKLLKQARNL
jgi:peptide deformylase